MANLFKLLMWHPLKSLKFFYTFATVFALLSLRRLLLPHLPVYQSLRIQLHRAFLIATSSGFPELARRLPVGELPPSRARRIEGKCLSYLIPGEQGLDRFASNGANEQPSQRKCLVLYSHGGGYARGEARMYVNYMERWVKVAREKGIDLAFLTVEYPLSSESSHPAQLEAVMSVYSDLLAKGIHSTRIVLMGDSAGGGLSILLACKLLGTDLPQPAAAVLISPWVDLELTAFEGGNLAVESDYFIQANESVPVMARMFLGENLAHSPEVNPLRHKHDAIRGLCPQMMLVGSAEFALHDSKAWAGLCDAAGIPHKMHIEPAQLHIYGMGSSFIRPRDRRRTDLQIIDWIDSHLE